MPWIYLCRVNVNLYALGGAGGGATARRSEVSDDLANLGADGGGEDSILKSKFLSAAASAAAGAVAGAADACLQHMRTIYGAEIRHNAKCSFLREE